LVHRAPENQVARIRKNGIAESRDGQGEKRGVFCMPVKPDYFASHQPRPPSVSD
jgi:hypothetical protein